jgi:hypothetical protein
MKNLKEKFLYHAQIYYNNMNKDFFLNKKSIEKYIDKINKNIIITIEKILLNKEECFLLFL